MTGWTPLCFGVVVELDRAEKIAVIGHGDGGHLLLDHQIHQLADFAGAVEQRVIGVAMQMDEGRCGTHLSDLLAGGRADSIVL